jgi:hypothetical protein
MKDCCKTGSESSSKIEIWTKRTLWGIVTLIVIGAVLNQLFNT